MSSSYDAGKSADRAAETKKERCPDAANGKHKWTEHGSWPSLWETCEYCDAHIFWK